MNGFSNDDPTHSRAHPLSQRRDMPHLWMHDGLWRVSAWNRNLGADLEVWHRANVFASRLNGPLLDARFGRACRI